MTNAAAKITYRNGFRAMKSLLKAAEDPRIQEIEGWGMDEGRVFICLKDGWVFNDDPNVPTNNHRSKSVGNASDIKYAMSLVITHTENEELCNV